MLSNNLILCHPNLSQSGSFPMSPLFTLVAKVLELQQQSIQWIFIVSAQCNSKCGPQICSISIIWELIRRWLHPKPAEGDPRICLTKPFRQLLCMLSSEKDTVSMLKTKNSLQVRKLVLHKNFPLTNAFLQIWILKKRHLRCYRNKIQDLGVGFGSSLGFPGGSDGKESADNARDMGSVPRLERPLGE